MKGLVLALLPCCALGVGLRQQAQPVAVAAAAQKNRTRGGIVVHDPNPVVLNFSNRGASPVGHNFSVPGMVLSNSTGPNFEEDPKNGTPWFRMKKQSDFGKADHSHFSGLAASGDFKEDVMKAHNVVRTRVGLSAVTWNYELQTLAEEYVATLVNGGCYIQHSSTSYRWNEGGFDYVGENLYKVINMKPTGVDITDAWYAEINDYSYGSVGDYCVKSKCASRSSPPCAMGHFTQVMWEASSAVGCARKKCLYEDDPTYIAVCYYGPGGNIGGNIPFNANAAAQLGVGAVAC